MKNLLKPVTIIIIAAALLLIVPALSYAESPYPNKITLEIAPSYRHVDTFTVDGFSTVIADFDWNVTSLTDNKVEFSDTGFGISGRLVIPAIRNSDRLIFELDYFRASDTSFTEDTRVETDDFFDILGIDGRHIGYFGENTDVSSTVGVAHRNVTLAALYGFCLPDNIIGNANLQVEAGLQFIESRNKLVLEQFNSGAVFSHFLDEKVTARYFGPVAGLFGTVPLSDKFTLTGRCRTGALLYRSRLDAEQISNADGTGVPDTVSFNGNETLFLEDHNSGIAYSGTLEAGIRYSVSNRISLDLVANITYLSKSPEIENPNTFSGIDDGGGFLDSLDSVSPVSLRTRPCKDAGIRLGVSIRLH
jgi:hypothetical protein